MPLQQNIPYASRYILTRWYEESLEIAYGLAGTLGLSSDIVLSLLLPYISLVEAWYNFTFLCLFLIISKIFIKDVVFV